MESRKTVLVADDDSAMRSMIADAMGLMGYEVIECRTGADLLRRMGGAMSPMNEGGGGVDLIVSDNRMPSITGLEVLKYAAQLQIEVPIILMTAFGSDWFMDSARQYGAAAVLSKPFDLEELITVISDLTGSSDGHQQTSLA